MTDSPGFIHLRVHSVYSLKEGALHVKKLPGLCEALGFPALAVTDTNALFGALEFSECCANAGVQPIMGLQLAVAYAGSAPGERPVEPAPLALYAQDRAGWLNLMALSSAAFLDTDTTQLPHVTLEALAARADGVICLTGGAGGPLGKLLQANRRPAAEALARRLAGMFPNRLYVELQRHGSGERPRTAPEEASEPGLIEIRRAEGGVRITYPHGEVFVPESHYLEVAIAGDAGFVPRTEADKAKAAKGLVPFQGKWMSP